MSALMLAQMGLSIAGSIGEYATASTAAKVQKSIQDYRNTMSKLQEARAMNAVTVNEIRTMDESRRNDDLIQRTAIADQSQAEVNAAAAGVKGNSVDMIARDLKASAGRASYAQRRQVHQQLADMGEQRKSIAIGTVMNKDVQVIPKPSVGALLLGAGTRLLDIYDSHQPPGDRLLRA